MCALREKRKYLYLCLLIYAKIIFNGDDSNNVIFMNFIVIYLEIKIEYTGLNDWIKFLIK